MRIWKERETITLQLFTIIMADAGYQTEPPHLTWSGPTSWSVIHRYEDEGSCHGIYSTDRKRGSLRHEDEEFNEMAREGKILPAEEEGEWQGRRWVAEQGCARGRFPSSFDSLPPFLSFFRLFFFPSRVRVESSTFLGTFSILSGGCSPVTSAKRESWSGHVTKEGRKIFQEAFPRFSNA